METIKGADGALWFKIGDGRAIKVEGKFASFFFGEINVATMSYDEGLNYVGSIPVEDLAEIVKEVVKEAIGK